MILNEGSIAYRDFVRGVENKSTSVLVHSQNPVEWKPFLENTRRTQRFERRLTVLFRRSPLPDWLLRENASFLKVCGRRAKAEFFQLLHSRATSSTMWAAARNACGAKLLMTGKAGQNKSPTT
jgi:hypothetical protein